MEMKYLKILAILGLMCFSSVVFAQKTSFIIGVEDLHYLPFYSTETGDYTGYARELLDAFGREYGYTFEYKAVPVTRLFHNFINGNVDFKFPDNPYWQSDLKEGKNVVYSDSAADYIDGVMVLPANKGIGVGRLKKLGIITGFTAWDYLSLIESGAVTTVGNSSFSGLLRQVINRRVNGAYMNPAVALYTLDNSLNKANALVFDPDLPHTKSSYFLSTIKYPEIIEKFNSFMVRKKDLVDRLKRKYRL